MENLPWFFEGKGENLDELCGKGLLRLLACLSGPERCMPRDKVLYRTHMSNLSLSQLIFQGWAYETEKGVILTEKGLELRPIALAIKEGLTHAVRTKLRAA